MIENPDLSAQYPHDNTFKAGQKYDFPFKFRIPEELADTACQVGVPNRKVKDLHRRLVPSLGNPRDAGMGVFLKSQQDMASPFCWIYYQVYVSPIPLLRQQPVSAAAVAMTCCEARLSLRSSICAFSNSYRTSEVSCRHVLTCLQVHILKTDPGPRKVVDLARTTRQVPVIPALDPEPPMLVEEKDTEYRTRHDIKYSGTYSPGASIPIRRYVLQ